MKLRFPDFRTITRAVTLPHATDATREIAQAAAALLESSLPTGVVGIRLLGVGISQFTGGERQQQLLFDDLAGQKHVSCSRPSLPWPAS